LRRLLAQAGADILSEGPPGTAGDDTEPLNSPPSGTSDAELYELVFEGEFSSILHALERLERDLTNMFAVRGFDASRQERPSNTRYRLLFECLVPSDGEIAENGDDR
jgi:hypothetical protein